MNFEYNIPSVFINAKGARYGVAKQARALSIRKPLIVSDTYMFKAGVVSDITDKLADEGFDFAVFSDIEGEPEIENVNNALKSFSDNDCDGIICIGGGSAIDTAKAAAVMATNPGTIADYMGYHKVVRPSVPLIAIPTTAGTGSEATRVVVITDTVNNVKMMCLDNAFMADIAIIDYELTMTMPKSLTAFVGVDALTHAIEAYVSRKSNIISDILALKAIELVSNNILVAYGEPGNEEARENMMVGATMAGAAFSNASVAAVHGMSRPLGAHFHIAHGLSNAMLLPVVTEYSLYGNIERYAGIAKSMGSEGGNSEELALKAIDRIKRLNIDLEIPTLKEYGVDQTEYEQAIPAMVESAIASGSPANNPKLFEPNEMAEIYIKAFDYK